MKVSSCCGAEVAQRFSGMTQMNHDVCTKCHEYCGTVDATSHMKSYCCGAEVYVVPSRYGSGKRWHCEKCRKPCEVVS